MTAEVVWNVEPEDEDMAQAMLEKKPVEIVLYCLHEAYMGDRSFIGIDVKIEKI